MPTPVEFAVWAPLPQRVRLQVEGAVHDMQREDDGWWRASVEAGPEADYGARLVLVRPDQFVAWTGDAAPEDPEALLRRITGRA